MVCVTITHDPRWVSEDRAIAIREILHRAVSEVMRVKLEDIELRIRCVGRHDVNSRKLTIEIDSGPGKDNWRLKSCRDIWLDLDKAISQSPEIPESLHKKEGSNMWLRIFAKGNSGPVGCPEQVH